MRRNAPGRSLSKGAHGGRGQSEDLVGGTALIGRVEVVERADAHTLLTRRREHSRRLQLLHHLELLVHLLLLQHSLLLLFVRSFTARGGFVRACVKSDAVRRTRRRRRCRSSSRLHLHLRLHRSRCRRRCSCARLLLRVGSGARRLHVGCPHASSGGLGARGEVHAAARAIAAAQRVHAVQDALPAARAGALPRERSHADHLLVAHPLHLLSHHSTRTIDRANQYSYSYSYKCALLARIQERRNRSDKTTNEPVEQWSGA